MAKMDREQIKMQAEEIIDRFVKELDRAGIKEDNSYVERGDFEREEGEGEDCGGNFKKMILDNAPVHDSDFVIAERGGWK